MNHVCKLLIVAMLLFVSPLRAGLIPESDLWAMWEPSDPGSEVAVDHSSAIGSGGETVIRPRAGGLSTA